MERARQRPPLRISRRQFAVGAVLAIFALLADSSPGLGQPRGGSLMRQMATLDGQIPEAEPWQSLAMPNSIRDRQLSPAVFQEVPVPTNAATGQGPGAQWSSPYEMTQQNQMLEEGSGWDDFLPDGCNPWGTRTSRDQRHVGSCIPLEGTSWLNRPLSAGWAIGALFCDDALDHQVDFNTGVYGIYRVGWDYDYYWGLEGRLGQATPAVHDRNLNTPDGTADVTLFDVSLLWYPTGDSRIRPYVCMGLGFQHFNFTDDDSDVVNTSTFSLPIGIGVKWMWTPWIALRLEATENWAVGNDQLDMMHNGALTAGMEIRFGGYRPSYWPWNPSRTLW